MDHLVPSRVPLDDACWFFLTDSTIFTRWCTIRGLIFRSSRTYSGLRITISTSLKKKRHLSRLMISTLWLIHFSERTHLLVSMRQVLTWTKRWTSGKKSMTLWIRRKRQSTQFQNSSLQQWMPYQPWPRGRRRSTCMSKLHQRFSVRLTGDNLTTYRIGKTKSWPIVRNLQHRARQICWNTWGSKLPPQKSLKTNWEP